MRRYFIGWDTSEIGLIQYKISESADGRFVLYDDAMAEIEALRAENDRLNKALKSAIC